MSTTSVVQVPGTKPSKTEPTIPAALVKSVKTHWQNARKGSQTAARELLLIGQDLHSAQGKYPLELWTKSTDVPKSSLSKAEKVYRAFCVRGNVDLDTLAALPSKRADGTPMAKLYAYADKVKNSKNAKTIVTKWADLPTFPKSTSKGPKGETLKTVKLPTDLYKRLQDYVKSEDAVDIPTFLTALCDEHDSHTEDEPDEPIDDIDALLNDDE